MTTKTIRESGMTFGPYLEDYCFKIEESQIYQRIQQGVKMAEFIWLDAKPDKSPKVFIVEAKSSTPRSENQPDFDGFIEAVRCKLVNAMSLMLATCLKRHALAESELPETFQALDLKNVEFRFILVVKDHKFEWLSPLQEALTKALRPTIKTWALSANAVVVLNADLACQYGLIRA